MGTCPKSVGSTAGHIGSRPINKSVSTTTNADLMAVLLPKFYVSEVAAALRNPWSSKWRTDVLGRNPHRVTIQWHTDCLHSPCNKFLLQRRPSSTRDDEIPKIRFPQNQEEWK